MTEHVRLPPKSRIGPARGVFGASSGSRGQQSGRYYAFLSYSHKDEELATWLHDELESFQVPASLAGKLTHNGVIPKRLRPIFRDEHELPASDDLGDEIQNALIASQFLIVLCSPDAAKSQWTNAEIDAFKRARPDGCVLAAIADGEPFASEKPGSEDQECFPPALRHKYDRRGRPTVKRAEPLAADLRDSGDGRRLGLLKIVAGMLGVGLDELVQRETTRRHRRLAWVAAASLGGMAITSTLALTAIHARDSAREQRREAEGLVAFMLGDLKDKLEPIGKLDALDGVGSRVLAYYSKQDKGELSDAALIQRSKALSLMGQVAYLRGHMNDAVRLYREAAAGSGEAVERQPDDPQRLFDHAQNIFWIAGIASEQGHLDEAERGHQEYKRLAARMVALEPNNMKWRMEAQYADANLGVVRYKQRRFGAAAAAFEQALRNVEALATADKTNSEYQQSVAATLAWYADARMSEGKLREAAALRQNQTAFLDKLAAASSDVGYRALRVPAETALGRLLGMLGDAKRGREHLRLAIAQGQELIALEPRNTVWLETTFLAHLALAELALGERDQGQAAAETNAGCAIVKRLLLRDSSYPQWRAGARDCATLESRIATVSGDPQRGLALAREAVRAAETVHSSDPDADRFALAKALRVRGDAERATGATAAAAVSWAAAASSLPSPRGERPSETAERVTILQRGGRMAEATQIRNRLAATGYRVSV